MNSVAVKKGYSAGATCLGEFSPLQMSNPSSRETNTVDSKIQKRLLTETSMELDLEIGDKQNIDAALPKGPNHHIEAVLHQEPNHHIEAVLHQGPNHHIEAVLHQGPNHHIKAVLHQGPNHHIEAVLHQGPNHNRATPSSVPLQGLNRATPSSVWPSDLITILQRIAATPCRQPPKPFFAFKFSLEAANKNFILLKCKFGVDLSKALLAQSNLPLGYGSEFKPIEMLELIFKNHPSWSRMKRILTHGSKWPLQPLNEENRIKDVEEALNFGNHKGAIKQQELLEKLVTGDVIRGFAIPLPLSKISQIPGILFAPLNIQAQNTINERGEIIPKNRLTHDQSWKWQSGTSVNSRVNKDELMPCYFGRTMGRLIKWVVAARKLYPNKRILATKLNVKAAYQRGSDVYSDPIQRSGLVNAPTYLWRSPVSFGMGIDRRINLRPRKRHPPERLTMAAAGAIQRRHLLDGGIQWLPVKPWTCSIGRYAPRHTAASPWQSKSPAIRLHFLLLPIRCCPPT